MGVNSSGINGLYDGTYFSGTSFHRTHFTGFALKKDEIYHIEQGDVLEILLGKYQYEIIFETTTNSSKNSESTSVSSAINSVAENGIDGVWENVEQGQLLVFTPNKVKASKKVFFKYFLVSTRNTKTNISNIDHRSLAMT